MSEMDILITAAVGGFFSSAVMSLVLFNQIKWAYDQKIETLRMQVVALQVAVGSGYE